MHVGGCMYILRQRMKLLRSEEAPYGVQEKRCRSRTMLDRGCSFSPKPYSWDGPYIRNREGLK